MSLSDMYSEGVGPPHPIHPLNTQWGDGPIRMQATAFAAFIEDYDNDLKAALGPYYNQDIGVLASVRELAHRMGSLED